MPARPALLNAAAGAYTIWDQDAFVYVGMSGRGLSSEALGRHRANGTLKGLATRLASHANGRRSGNQFCGNWRIDCCCPP